MAAEINGKKENPSWRTCKFPDSLNISMENCGDRFENILYVCGIPRKMSFWKTVKCNTGFVHLN